MSRDTDVRRFCLILETAEVVSSVLEILRFTESVFVLVSFS